mmetsp:Transcript_86212/g.143420  ORF Transcript_86212/g.143420 Transcript_86212/m.143420 type:complete len:130 (+) Transcript_86212:495-884(+)
MAGEIEAILPGEPTLHPIVVTAGHMSLRYADEHDTLGQLLASNGFQVGDLMMMVVGNVTKLGRPARVPMQLMLNSTNVLSTESGTIVDNRLLSTAVCDVQHHMPSLSQAPGEGRCALDKWAKLYKPLFG